jgi:hypothetical protein
MAKPYASLIPSIEQRESAWVHLREQHPHPQEHRHPTVTISRQYGCEGYPLAERLKLLLEDASGQLWNIYDKALVDKVVTQERISRQLLNHLGDESHAQDVLLSHFGYHTHDEAYEKLVKHLLEIAKTGCAIIVGRGGAVACQDLPNCFHFRLIGSSRFRATTIGRRLEMSEAEADEFVHRQSKLREKFISQCLHADISAPQWYDAIFNNERQSVEAIAQACLGIITTQWPDKGYFKHGLSREAATT